MKILSCSDLVRMIDVSGVRADVSMAEVERIAAVARREQFICAFAMPCFTRFLVEKLADEPAVGVGGVVGFPSGADTTFMKVAAAKEMMGVGVDELDMVINIGALKSGLHGLVRDDIRAVVEVANGLPVKSILEVAYLTDDEICKGSELAVEAGVSFVKTGTGWAGKPTTVEHIRLIRQTIGDAARIKAAGGIRTLQTLIAMVEAGCSRFGIGLNSALGILDEARKNREEGEK